MTQIPILKGDDEKMRTKHCTITLILIQLFVISAIVGAVSSSVSATHNDVNTTTGSSEFPEPPITEDDAFNWFNRANDLKPEFVPGEVLVKFKTSISVGLTSGAVTTGIESIDRLNKRFEVKGMKRVFSNVYKLNLPEDVDVLSVAREYELSPNVEFAEPNGIYHTLSVPNDTEYWRQWAHEVTEAEFAWNVTIGDPSVLVAVLDTGIDYNHPDLDDNYVELGRGDPMDDNGHGTHCAGIIAAEINNNIGVAGVAQIQIMAEKVLGSDGKGSWEGIASGILHAADQGADIISMSLGGNYNSSALYYAVKNVSDRGVLLVAAAGNSFTSEKHYPAGYDEVIAVSATNSGEGPAWFTNFGDWIDVAAPGYHIYSTWLGGSYEYASGTSMACPYVAGVAALIKSQFPNMSNVEIRNHLRNTTDDLGTLGFDQIYGYGRVNARWAVDHVSPEHDLRLWGMEAPKVLKPGTTAVINCTVLNFGQNEETNVSVQLLVDEDVVQDKEISTIQPYDWADVNFSWTPQIEGECNVTLYVVPTETPPEDFTNNNAKSIRTFVRVEEVVRVPEDFSMIQKAVSASPLGYTIQVSNGTYYEQLDIEKSLSLEAKDQGTTVIDPDWHLVEVKREVIFVGADNVSISNFSIPNGEYGIATPGFWFMNKSINNLSINNNVITNITYAIILDNTKFSTIIDNSISNNAYGITLSGCNNTSIRGNTVSNNTSYGISTKYPKSPLPTSSSSNNSFQGNIASNSEKGMNLINADNNSIVANDVSNNTHYGIYLDGSKYNNITENWVSNNGVRSYDSGIYLYASYDNVIYHNNFINNINQAYQSESLFQLNAWDDGYPSGGNYWSDYEERYPDAEELDDSGTWDTPYEINSYNQDNHPLLHPWGSIRNVNTDKTYLTIQKAIDASQTSNGHTIEVKADTYYENVVVDKDLTIIGEDPNTTIIDGNHISTKNVVTIETATATISGFTIQHGPRSGIKVHLSPPGVTIIGNIITHNFVGISIEDYTQNVQIVDNVLANQYGIYLKNTENNIINSNIMSDNGYAITLSQSDGNTIKENTISNSGYSIYVGSSSDNNVIHHNNFINSTSGPVSSGSNNAWDDGYPSGGNYWSDYNGTDLYSGPYQNETGSDGIGDTPYVIDANDQDNYPLIRPWGSIRNIDTGLIYLTIQKAIDASQTSNGHTIEVKAGTYYENVVVDKSLTLIGENTSTTIIDGSGTGNVVTVQANSSSIRRFTIQNGQYGIYVKQNSNIYIDNNTVSNNQGGICLWRSINCSVSSNTVSNNRDIVSGPGIMIYNDMPGLGVGNHAVTDNIVIDNYDGIRVHSSRDNVICGNIVANNTHDGIYLDGGKYNNITENWVSNNECGINLYASYDNVIYHNNFINNTNQAYQSESPFQLNAWDDGYPSGGNYWSDYNGTDLYSGPYQNETGSDGIGDTSYDEINQYNQDNYPLKDPWNGYYWYLLYEPWNQLASWTKEGTGVSNIAIKDGKNCLRNKPNKSNYVTQYKDVGTLPETGYTAETSLYVDSWGDGDPESFVAFKFYDGMHRVTIEIHSDRVVGAQNNLSVQTNATQWYTWRFLIDSDADTIDVYRDGQHVGTLTGLTDSTANDGLVHCAWTQNPSESNGCESYTDYIKIAPGLHTPS